MLITETINLINLHFGHDTGCFERIHLFSKNPNKNLFR